MFLFKPYIATELVNIKKRAIAENRFEKTSANLVLMPEKAIPYIVLVHVMDAARGKEAAKEFAQYEKEPHKLGLFSAVSFAGGLN